MIVRSVLSRLKFCFRFSALFGAFVLCAGLFVGCAGSKLDLEPGNVVSAPSGDSAVRVVVSPRYRYMGERSVKGEMYGLKMSGPVHLFTSPGSGYVSVGTFTFRRHDVSMPEGGPVLDSGTVELNGKNYRYAVVVADLDIIHYLYIPAGGGRFMFVSYVESLRGRPEPPQAWLFEQLTYSQLKFVNDFKKRALESYEVGG